MYLALELIFVSSIFIFFLLVPTFGFLLVQVQFLFLLVLIAVETALGLSLLTLFLRKNIHLGE
jgi:NADH:ubiquinone oxidoreductase subunit K